MNRRQDWGRVFSVMMDGDRSAASTFTERFLMDMMFGCRIKVSSTIEKWQITTNAFDDFYDYGRELRQSDPRIVTQRSWEHTTYFHNFVPSLWRKCKVSMRHKQIVLHHSVQRCVWYLWQRCRAKPCKRLDRNVLYLWLRIDCRKNSEKNGWFHVRRFPSSVTWVDVLCSRTRIKRKSQNRRCLFNNLQRDHQQRFDHAMDC